jgi:hypothetical protein
MFIMKDCEVNIVLCIDCLFLYAILYIPVGIQAIIGITYPLLVVEINVWSGSWDKSAIIIRMAQWFERRRKDVKLI